MINYNVPNHLEGYVHRVDVQVGLKEGTAFISTSEERYAHLMVKALKKAKEEVLKNYKSWNKVSRVKLSEVKPSGRSS